MRTFVKTYCQSYRMSLAVDRLVPKQHIGNSAVELNSSSLRTECVLC